MRKKVILRTLTDELHPGYLPATGFVSATPPSLIDLLDLSGRLNPVPLDQVRTIAFVRDFNLADRLNPENLLRRTFLARPRTEGLWVRLTFTAGDTLEGLAPLDLSLLDGVLHDHGLFLIPPDTRSNTQRLFIPRAAIASLQLLTVITTPSKPRPTPAKPTPSDDLTLDFSKAEPEDLT